MDLWTVEKKTRTMGNRSTNSTSKIKKIKVIRKNWRDKVWRLFSQGENPHSKGDNFRESTERGHEITINVIIKNNEIIKVNIKFL